MSDLVSIAETACKFASANLRPKKAATLILVNRSGCAPKVLMGKRHSSHAFLPDRFVFPEDALSSPTATYPPPRPWTAASKRG